MAEAASDITFMRRAIELADAAAGRTAPNPLVGAVVVSDGRIVGEGYHAGPGQAHAEVVALRQAGERARGATLYVTLEPCDHFGRTPPCTGAILEAGVRCVKAAVGDPDPKVSGRGFARLRQAGVEVEVGVAQDEAAYANRFYLTSRRFGRPHVLYKYAMTVDGRVATPSGDSRWVSGEEARAEVHRLRDRLDAVLVGIGTVLRDDPLLTCRLPAGEGPGRSPLRVVADSHGQTPTSALALAQGSPGTLVLVTAACPTERRDALASVGALVQEVASDEAGHCLPTAILDALHRRGCLGVLLEGGPRLAASLWAADLIDEIACAWAPKIVGSQAPGPFGPGLAPGRMADAAGLRDVRIRPLGSDLWLQALVGRDSARCLQD